MSSKHRYGLRPHTSKVHKQNPSPSACNKNKRFRKVKPMISKWLKFNADTSKEKCQNTGGNQSSSCGGMDVSDVIQESGMAGVTDLENDAFQLANYVESDIHLDGATGETQTKNLPNWTSADIFDLQVENMSVSDASLDELLDFSIDELQKMANSSNAGASSVACQNRTTNEINSSRDVVVNDGNANRLNDHKDASNVCGMKSCKAIDHNDQSDKSDSSSEHLNMLSKEPASNVGDQARSFSALRRPNPYDRQTILKKQTVSSSASVSTPSLSKDAVRQTPYTTLTKNVALKQKLTLLFNRPCHKYMNDQCSGRMCKWNHNLPPAREVYRKLMLLGDETVRYIYFNFVSRTNKAFVTYFPSMCEVLGKRKMKSLLVRAIGKCEEWNNVEYLKFVFDGLVLTGTSKQEALSTVTDCCSKTRKCYDVLLEIMIETDALYFVDKLKEYYLYGTISKESMHKLLQQVVVAPTDALLSVFVDILDKYSMCRSIDEGTIQFIIPRVKDLVKGNLSLAQQLNHIIRRMK